MSVPCFRIIFAIVAAFALAGCARPSRAQDKPTSWSISFWYWPGNGRPYSSAGTVADSVYVNVGDASQGRGPDRVWDVFGEVPGEVPPAHAYWLVFRVDGTNPPDQTSIQIFRRRIAAVLHSARSRKWNVVGVQFDFDSPTRLLPEYAQFLRSIRQNIDPNLKLSITALLDWFREGTAVGDVIAQVDEFVPQFYDLDSQSYRRGLIAAPVSAREWGERLNRFRKPFKLGISAFGRAQMLRAKDGARPSDGGMLSYRDVSPIEFALNPAFRTEASSNPGGELIVDYRAESRAMVAFRSFGPGEGVRFIEPTRDAMRASISAAKQMGPYAAGVIIFRWPTETESLVLPPEEALAAASDTPEAKRIALTALDGGCVAVKCVDLLLTNIPRESPHKLWLRIQSSQRLAYFLPKASTVRSFERRMPWFRYTSLARISDPTTLEVSLPAFMGVGRIYLGRVMTENTSQFRVEEVK
jgi:hypothetical protein